MTHPRMFDDGDPVLARLREMALGFPDAREKISHGIPAFFTTKVFAYYGGSQKLGDRHERHPSSVLVLAEPDERRALLQDPRCYLPAYFGPYGWVGLDLPPAAAGSGDSDWAEVAELLDASYRLTAGPRRVARLDRLSASG